MGVETSLLVHALDALPDSLIIADPVSSVALFANAPAREARLVDATLALDSRLLAAIAEHRELREQLRAHRCQAPAQRFAWGGEVWWLRTARIKGGVELVLCRRGRLREGELLGRVRTLYGLTPRQSDVLRHVLRGRSNPEIAREMKIAYATVRRHLSDVLAALGVRSRAAIFELVDRLR